MSTSNRTTGPAKPLTSREKDILEQLDGLVAKLNEFDNLPAEEMEQRVKDEAVAQIFHEYHDAILKAFRARLEEHPLVKNEIRDFLKEGIDRYKKMGQRDYLRRVRRGLEKGIKRPLTEEEVKLLNAVEELRWGDRLSSLSIHLRQGELASPTTFDEIFQKVGKGEIISDPENPPFEKKPRSWEEVLKILVQRGVIPEMSRQAFLRKLKRLDPLIF